MRNLVDRVELKSIHPFPARMAPSIALEELEKSNSKSLRVLDPMAGSGTTVVLAKLLGHRAVGIDADPLAVILARSWSISSDLNGYLACAADVLIEAENRFHSLKQRDAYPSNADKETKSFVRFWFDVRSRKQLRSLSDAIAVAPLRYRDLLWVAFSRTIIAKSRGASLAMDLSHSRPHKVFDKAPLLPFAAFTEAAGHVAKNAPFVRTKAAPKSKHPDAKIQLGDARRTGLRASSIDLVVTSPPYLNAIDYIRCSKFSLVWMGVAIQELRNTRSGNIGSEVGLGASDSLKLSDKLNQVPARKKLPNRWGRILDRYVRDLDSVVSETQRVLTPGGRAVFVVGDSRVQGVFVSNSRIVEMLAAEHGLTLADRTRRVIPENRRYLPPPKHNNQSGSIQSRMRYEVILRFRKPK